MNGMKSERIDRVNRIRPSEESDFQSVIMGFIAEQKWRYITLNSHCDLAVKTGSSPQSMKIIMAEMSLPGNHEAHTLWVNFFTDFFRSPN